MTSPELAAFAPLEGMKFAVIGTSAVAEYAIELLEDLGATTATVPWSVTAVAEAAAMPAAGVIADRVDLSAPPPAAYLTEVQARHRGPWVTLSPFGLDGPHRDHLATEFTLDAAGGLVSSCNRLGSDSPEPPPSQAAGAVATAGVLALLASLDPSGDGRPPHLDLSAQEAIIAQGPFLEILHLLLRCPGAPGSSRFGTPTGWYRCAHGWLLVLGVEKSQRDALLAFLNEPQVIAETGVEVDSMEAAARSLEAWTARRDSADAEAILQSRGVPVAKGNGLAGVLGDEHTVSRGALLTADGRVTRTPLRIEGADSQSRAPRGVRGLKVLEVGSLLAVPLAGAVLGALGAQVTRLEDTERLDNYRRNGPFIDGIVHHDNGAYFAGANHSTTNRSTAGLRGSALLDEHVATADVVLNNLGRRTELKWGLDPVSVRTRNPEALAISSSGFGSGGVRESYRAYAYNIHAFSGIVFGDDEGAPAPLEVNTALADMCTAYSVALLVTAWAVGPSATPMGIDLSMAEIMAVRMLARSGTKNDRAVRRDVLLQCADGHWVAATIESGRQSAALAALNAPDEDLAAAVANLDTRTVVAALQSVAVPAALVQTAHSLVTDQHLVHRGLFQRVAHPVADEVRVVGLPWREVGSPREPLGPVPAVSVRD